MKFKSSFINGIFFALGIMLVFDISLVHWFIGLHHVTGTAQDMWLEPLLFVMGLVSLTLSSLREFK